MKRNAIFCLVLCLCLLLSACSKPELPEESDLSAEESGASTEPAPAPEDPDAKIVRAYLEELLTHEPESGSTEWLTAERAEAIRESVKQLKTPILTEDDVLRIAERAAAFYCAAVEEKRTVSLPAYGPVRAVRLAPAASASYLGHAVVYNALLAYTFYLFTPPDYLVRESELRAAGLSDIFGASPSFARAEVVLCLPLAAAYATRQEALASLRREGGCILLYPSAINDGEHPLDVSDCTFDADILQPGGCKTLDLFEMAGDSMLRFLEAPAYVQAQADRLLYYAAGVPWKPLYDGAGALAGVYMPFSPEEARGLRAMADLCDEPYLLESQMENLARLFRDGAYEPFDPDLPILLPDADGTGEVLLDPKVMPQEERLQRVMAYTVDLLTPRAYRFTDLTDRAGTYFATGNWIRHLLSSTVPEGGFLPDTPETMLKGFYAGAQQFVLVTEEYELYLIDGEGNTEPLFVREDVTE